jgi:hypothetical protein
MTSRHSIPDGHPDVLHNIVHVARTPDARQVRHDVALHSVHGHHDLIDRDGTHGGLWGSAQGNIDDSLVDLFFLGLIRPGFDSHGLHRFNSRFQYVRGQHCRPLKVATKRANHDYKKAMQTIVKDT